MENNNPQGQINIELDEKTAEGIYSNLAIINHSNSEFVIDFIRLMPGVPKAKVKSRIVISVVISHFWVAYKAIIPERNPKIKHLCASFRSVLILQLQPL